MPQSYEDKFENDVLANILRPTDDAELTVIADQCLREVRSGANLDQILTEASYALGLSVEDIKKVEAKVLEATGGMDKYAGLKSTLRKLRKQLEGHDGEDLDGMNKLLSAIKGVEDQLKSKEDKREERRKKKESKPSEDDKEAEAAVDLTAAPADPAPGGPDPAGNPQPAPLPTTPEVQNEVLNTEIDFLEATKRVEAKLKEIKAGLEQAERIPEMRAKVEQQRPMFMAWLQSIEGQIVLVQRGAGKYQALLSGGTPRTDAGGILKRFVELATQAMKDGEEWATKALQVLKGLLGSPSYKTEVKPSLKFDETPKTKQNLPHMQLPPGRASLRRKADDAEALGHILEALEDALTTAENYLSLAEMN